MPRVTLRDIADEANVHVSTVSRTLAQARRGVAPRSESGRRIISIAERAGYEHDVLAAGLRTRRTHMLGVLVPRLTDITLSTIYEGLDERAAAVGYQTVVANTLDSPHEQRRRAELLLTRRVDGLILGDARSGDAYLDDLEARRVPFVLVNRAHSRFDSVTCDDYGGGRLVGHHLAGLGHEHIGIIAGRPDASTAVDRTRGCIEALHEHGIDVPPQWLVHSSFSPDGGREAAMRVMAHRHRPTALFAVTDLIALGVMGALRDRHLTVGADVAVAGFNDIVLARELLVPLTTVRSPMGQIGAEAAQLLIDRLDESELPEHGSRSVVLDSELVVRESTLGPAANG